MATVIKTIEELNTNVNEGVTTLDELSLQNNDKVKVIKVNVDNSPEVAQQFDVPGIPALFFFKEGEVKGSDTGNLPLTELQKRVDTLLHALSK
jgi:thioredoxin 1